MTLLFFLVAYIIIGAILLPMFTRNSYKQILAAHNEMHPLTPNANHKNALEKCKYIGLGRATTWPISLPLHFSLLQITKQAEAAERKRIADAETARILADYNRDPVEEEFKKLEEDEKKKEELEEQNKIKEATQKRDEYWKKKIKEIQDAKKLNTIQATGGYSPPEYQEAPREYYTSTNKRVVSKDNKLGNPITKQEADRLIDLYKKEITLLTGLKEFITEEYKSGQSTTLYYNARMADVRNRFSVLTEEVQILHSRILMSKRDNVFKKGK